MSWDVIPDEHERSWPRWVALYVLVLAGALLGAHAPGGPPSRPGRSGRAAGTVGSGTEGPLPAASLALRMRPTRADRGLEGPSSWSATGRWRWRAGALTHRLGRAKTGKTVHLQLTPLDHGQVE
jgi:hypothetical protein